MVKHYGGGSGGERVPDNSIFDRMRNINTTLDQKILILQPYHHDSLSYQSCHKSS